MAAKGELNGQWRGEAVGYKSLHVWIRRNYPLLGVCEICGQTKKPTEYASKDHGYTRQREDWVEVCRSCHRKMDGSYERTPEIRAAARERSSGRYHTDATKAKISDAKRGRKLGPHSAERRAKTAAAKRAYWAKRKGLAP